MKATFPGDLLLTVPHERFGLRYQITREIQAMLQEVVRDLSECDDDCGDHNLTVDGVKWGLMLEPEFASWRERALRLSKPVPWDVLFEDALWFAEAEGAIGVDRSDRPEPGYG